MEGLRCLMEAIDGPRVVAVESNVEAAVTAVRELQPSLLIVDKGLGVPTFTDWMRLLSVAEKPTAVIVWGSESVSSVTASTMMLPGVADGAPFAAALEPAFAAPLPPGGMGRCCPNQ